MEISKVDSYQLEKIKLKIQQEDAIIIDSCQFILETSYNIRNVVYILKTMKYDFGKIELNFKEDLKLNSKFMAHGSFDATKDHCFIVSHVAIAGNVIIEPYCFLGINATIRNRIKIAKKCIIGAGAVILENTNEGEVYTAGATKKLAITSDKVKNF